MFGLSAFKCFVTNETIIQGIQEGCDRVLANANTDELCDLVYKTLERHVAQALQEFTLDRTTLVVREIPSWVNLTNYKNPSAPYSYDHCLQTKKGVSTFKKPKNSFILALVMSTSQWAEFQLYLEEKEVKLSFLDCS